VKSQSVIKARESAEQSFAAGLYCAESVVLALSEAQGISSDLLPKVATAFCSGMARTCGTCGALTGAMMGISLAFGRSAPGASVEPTYGAVRQLVREFEREFGGRDCHVLLGCDLATAEGRAVFRQKKLASNCATYTGRAAEIAARIIAEGDKRPFVDTAKEEN